MVEGDSISALKHQPAKAKRTAVSGSLANALAK
jgi:hypothetical protein